MLGRSASSERFDRLFGAYGELIHETCEALIPPANQPTAVFRTIVRQLRKECASPAAVYEKYERSWIFRIVTDKVRRHGRQESAKDPEHQNLFSSGVSDHKRRLKSTQSYLLRLPVESRTALFLSRRHAFGEDEIASILNMPCDSLALTTRQAMETMREWIWQGDTPPPAPEADAVISEALQNWTSKPLPEELKNTPLADNSRGSADRKSRWQRTPWYVRSGMEALALAMVILAVVALVPKVRNIYERSLENQLSTFDVNEDEISSEEFSGSPPPMPVSEDDFSGAEGDSEGEVSSGEEGDSTKVSLAGAQIWRFYIRTHSPAELRPLIVKAIKGAKLPPDPKRNEEGIEAPGGIQFNLLVPNEFVQPLRKEIRAIASQGPEGEATHLAGNFTWYVTKAKTRMTKGHARVVIWVYRLM